MPNAVTKIFKLHDPSPLRSRTERGLNSLDECGWLRSQDHRDGCQLPDGIVVDVEAGHIYWTNMGVPNLNDGSIERADLDGKNRKTIVPQGGTHTPKQIISIRRAASSTGAIARGCASCAAISTARRSKRSSKPDTAKPTAATRRDGASGWRSIPKLGQIYWTQKGPDNAGLGRIFRASVEIPEGETAATSSDIEVFFDGLPEPIDLEIDRKNRILYWTDRGDPPRGNTVNRASIDNKPAEPEIVVTHLMEGIGIALDVPDDRMFVTDFAGSLYSARLDGSGERNFLAAQGNLTGIAYAEV